MVSPRAPQRNRVTIQALAPLRPPLLESPAVSLAVTFPMITASGFAVGALLLVLVLALALALVLLPFAFAPPLVDSADVHRRGACQCVAGHDDASDLFSHQRIR